MSRVYPITHDILRVQRGLTSNAFTADYQKIFHAEAQRIRAQLARHDPCSIACLPGPGGKAGHAVLATASVYAQNVYDAPRSRLIQTMQIFNIYNPNTPYNRRKEPPTESDVNNRFLVALDTGNTNVFPLLQAQPNDAEFAGLILWVQSSYNGPPSKPAKRP